MFTDINKAEDYIKLDNFSLYYKYLGNREFLGILTDNEAIMFINFVSMSEGVSP